MKKLLILSLSAMLCVGMTACAGSDYKKAMKLYEDQDYEAAGELFKELSYNEYKDSEQLLESCKYQMAMKAYNAGNFENAKEMFWDISDFENSKEMAKDCDYSLAKKAFDSGDYETAASGFKALGDYKDSADCHNQAAEKQIVKKIIGTWTTGDIDMSTKLKAYFRNSGAGELLDYCDFPAFNIYYQIQFNEDNTYSVSMDLEKFKTDFRQMATVLKEGFNSYLEKELKNYSFLGIKNIDDLFKLAYNMSFDEFFDFYTSQLYELVETEGFEKGTYQIDGKEIRFSFDDLSADGKYDIADDTFTMINHDTLAIGDIKLCPMTFTKMP